MSGWAGSTRAQRLPRDWPARRKATKERAAGRCEGVDLDGTGQRTHVPTCDGIGTDCDHDIRGDDHSLSNLRWLSLECHKAKTAAEQPKRARPRPTHPGLL